VEILSHGGSRKSFYKEIEVFEEIENTQIDRNTDKKK
jgi:hypothetical protein